MHSAPESGTQELRESKQVPDTQGIQELLYDQERIQQQQSWLGEMLESLRRILESQTQYTSSPPDTGTVLPSSHLVDDDLLWGSPYQSSRPRITSIVATHKVHAMSDVPKTVCPTSAKPARSNDAPVL